MKFSPLPNSLLLISLLGLIIIGFKLANGTIDVTWGFTFMVMCLIFLTSSFLSITPQDSDFKE